MVLALCHSIRHATFSYESNLLLWKSNMRKEQIKNLDSNVLIPTPITIKNKISLGFFFKDSMRRDSQIALTLFRYLGHHFSPEALIVHSIQPVTTNSLDFIFELSHVTASFNNRSKTLTL